MSARFKEKSTPEKIDEIMTDPIVKLSDRVALDSSDRQNFARRLPEVLAEIAIESDYSIVYKDHQPIVVDDRYRAYLQQIDSQEGDRYLTTKLQNYLYAIFNGELKAKEEGDRQTIVNQADEWYTSKFYHQLVECNHGRGYEDSGWLVVRQERQYWQVSKEGLTVYIDPEKDLFDSTLAQIGSTISVIMPANLVDRGLYIAIGDAGSVNRPDIAETTLLQLYLGIKAHGAPNLLSLLTQELNSLKIPFDFKLAYREADYERVDAAVLEFVSSDWEKLQPIIKNIYLENRSYFTTKIPFFCLPLANGLGLAEKPNDMFENRLENLGRQYCRLIAKAIVNTSKQTNPKHKNNYRNTLYYFNQLKADINKIYLNPTSNTVYKLAF